MANGERAAKMADRIKEIVARRLEKGIKDPRLGFVTITDVRVTGDLQHASVFYTVYGDDQAREDTAAALKAAMTDPALQALTPEFHAELTGALQQLIRDRRPDVVDMAGWRAIDAAEIARGGADRPRDKFIDVSDMLAAAANAPKPTLRQRLFSW